MDEIAALKNQPIAPRRIVDIEVQGRSYKIIQPSISEIFRIRSAENDEEGTKQLLLCGFPAVTPENWDQWDATVLSDIAEEIAELIRSPEESAEKKSEPSPTS